MIAAGDLITLFRQPLAEEWGYIWGEAGDVWTAANQRAAEREMTVRYGSKWVGRRVADCSGLFVWAYGERGEKIYHGSNTIFDKYTAKTGALAGEVEILPGTAVFRVKKGRRTHIGLYVGAGKVIEARGTQSGVIESDLEWWDEWGTLKAVDYSGVEPEVVLLDIPALRKGDKGLTVAYLQDLLWQAGYDIGDKGADGIFGTKTQAAVEEFQRRNGLTVDGIAGKLTMAALRQVKPDEAEVPEDDEPEEELTTSQKVEILWAWYNSQNGGDPDGQSP